MSNKILPLDIYPRYGQRIQNATGFKRLLYKWMPIPLHTYFPLRVELRMLWVRLISRHVYRRYMHAKNLLVNIGCGSKGKQGWVNVDIFKHPGVNCIYDCRKQLPFPDESVRGIFCEHFFEHIDYTEEVPMFLSECHRVLQPNGVIRIIVPDAEKYLKGYFEGWDALKDIRPLKENHQDFYFGGRYNTKMELINVSFRQGYQHRFLYDAETLIFVLKRYGFSQVHHQGYNKSVMPELLIDQVFKASESLYVEGVK